MSLRKFFSRNKEVITSEAKAQHAKNKIACDTAELKELITEWTQREGWEFENFADFIELVGVKTPVKLSELDKKSSSFKCVTALNKEIRISLFFGSWIEYCSEINITDGKETRIYTVNSNIEKGKSVPKVTLQRRSIKKSGKELNSFYCESFCNRTLKLDDSHVLKIEISEPDMHKDKPEILVLRNCEKIEEYLLGLDSSLVVDAVYKKIMEFLNLSDEDISKCEKILISYIEIVGKVEQVRGKIFLLSGKMQEYAILENKETFHVFKNGNWKYLSDNGIKIDYFEEMKQYAFSLSGTEEDITTINTSEIMNRVKVKISELLEFVK